MSERGTMGAGTIVVDTETHLFERAWPIETMPDAPLYEHVHWHAHDGHLLVSEMARANVDLALVIGYDGYDFQLFMERLGSSPADFYGGERYARSFVEQYPDRLALFTALKDPRVRESLGRLEQQLEGGAIGTKFFPAYLGLSFDHPSIAPVLDLVERSGRCLMVGLEDSADIAEELRAATRILAERPGLHVQFNHGANVRFDVAEEVEALRALVRATESVFISSSVLGGPLMEWEDGTEYPFPRWLAKLERLIDAVGPGRAVWGTDWPWFEHFGKYPQFVDAVRFHAQFLNDEERGAYLGGNACRYLRRDPAAHAGKEHTCLMTS